jgi:hypothetical protein
VEIRIKEYGYEQAMFGLSLNKKQPVEKMPRVALRLRNLGGGHTKFSEAMMVWADITAPHYWWKHMDAYRIGVVNVPQYFPAWLRFFVNLILAVSWPPSMPVTKQSDSVMFNVLKHPLSQADFEDPINSTTLDYLNKLRDNKDFKRLVNELPGGYLQRRMVVLNYHTIRYIFNQRRGEKISQWQFFENEIMRQVSHPELLEK